MAEVASVTPDYFRTLGVPLKVGAYFPATLGSDAPSLAIVNESLARHFWPDENPVGRRVRLRNNDRWLEIVGVVADVRMPVRIDMPATRFQLYRPLAQFPARYFNLALRSTVAPETLAPAIRRVIANLDPDLPVAGAGPVRDDVDRKLSNVRLVIANLGQSAFLGLLVAALGLFGVISQFTAQRTREIGVRIALGAQSRDVLRLVLGETARPLFFGVVIGVPAIITLGAFLGRMLPELPIPGPWLLVVNVAALAGTMLAASWLPAHRASHINPVEALRAE